MLPMLFYWPMTSEANVGGMAVEAEPSTNIPLHFVTMQQMAAEGQSDRVASDTELCTELNSSLNALETTVAMLAYCKVCTRWVP